MLLNATVLLIISACFVKRGRVIQITFIQIQEIILADGWYLSDIVGSHYHYKHPMKKGKVTIPHHNKSKDLNQKTISSIFKQAQIER